MSIRLSTLGLAALCGAAATSGAWAAEYGTVISSTPVMSTAPVVQRECVDEAAAAPRRSSNGAGAAVGALFGAALGNAMGGGSGRALSTGIGMIAGAALGNHAEAQEAAGEAATVQRCRDVTRTSQRIVAYDVVYEYQGVQRRVRMAQPPGDRILLEVQVVPASAELMSAPTRYAEPEHVARPPVEAAPRVYRSPGDNRIDDEPAAARRGGYYDDRPLPPPAPAAREAANPVPYLIVGGLTALAIAHAVKSDRPRHPYRHPPRWPRH